MVVSPVNVPGFINPPWLNLPGWRDETSLYLVQQKQLISKSYRAIDWTIPCMTYPSSVAHSTEWPFDFRNRFRNTLPSI